MNKVSDIVQMLANPKMKYVIFLYYLQVPLVTASRQYLTLVTQQQKGENTFGGVQIFSLLCGDDIFCHVLSGQAVYRFHLIETT